MKKIIASLIAVFAIAIAANAAEYAVNDDAIDTMIENCIEVGNPLALDMAAASNSNSAVTVQAAGANPAVVIVVTFFLGYFGVHRHILGTNWYMWALYTFTLGGIFGVVPLVDFIVEIVETVDSGSLAKYENNGSFFMWA